MKCSVIIAVYNEDKTLEKCLASLLSQKQADFEVIVVDDGSALPVTSFTWPELQDGRVRVIKSDHVGPAKARNLGVKESKGEVLVFLDGDMYFEADFLSQLIEPILSGKERGTYSTQEYVANWDNLWARCWNWENGFVTERRVDERDTNIRDFRAIRTDEFNKVKGFDDTGYTDSWTLSRKLGYKPGPTEAKYYHYNPDSLTDVYLQAKWIGGRDRKGRLVGKLAAVLRALPPVSFAVALVRSIKFGSPAYILFKLVYDLGILTGVLANSKKK